MKKVLLTSALCMGVMTSANAIGITPYVSAKLNLGQTKAHMEVSGAETLKSKSSLLTGGAFAVGASFDINDMFAVRAEGEFAFNYAKFKDAPGEGPVDISMLNPAFGVNLYFDWRATDRLVPYIGAGLGYGLAGLKYADFDDSYEWKAWNDKRYGGLNYNFTIGAAYAVTDRLSADLGLRYTEQIMLDDGPWKTSFNAYSVLLGARYMF